MAAVETQPSSKAAERGSGLVFSQEQKDQQLNLDLYQLFGVPLDGYNNTVIQHNGQTYLFYARRVPEETILDMRVARIPTAELLGNTPNFDYLDPAQQILYIQLNRIINTPESRLALQAELQTVVAHGRVLERETGFFDRKDDFLSSLPHDVLFTILKQENRILGKDDYLTLINRFEDKHGRIRIQQDNPMVYQALEKTEAMFNCLRNIYRNQLSPLVLYQAINRENGRWRRRSFKIDYPQYGDYIQFINSYPYLPKPVITVLQALAIYEETKSRLDRELDEAWQQTRQQTGTFILPNQKILNIEQQYQECLLGTTNNITEALENHLRKIWKSYLQISGRPASPHEQALPAEDKTSRAEVDMAEVEPITSFEEIQSQFGHEQGVQCYESLIAEARQLFINQELMPVFEGWQEAEADGLDKIAERLTERLANLTFSDILKYFDVFVPMMRNNFLEHFQAHREKSISDFKALIEKHHLQEITPSQYLRRNSHSGSSSDLKVYEQIRRLRLGEPFHYWLSEALKDPNPEIQAKALYLAFNTENPFLFIPDEITNLCQRFYRQQLEAKDGKAVNLNSQERKTAVERISHLLMESGFSSQEKAISGFGYCRFACHDLITLLGIPGINLRLFRDLLNFSQKQKVMLPPQIINLFERLKQEYGGESYREAVTSFYQANPDNNLVDKFIDLNVAVASLNRVYENPEFYTHVPKRDGVYLSLFSGPRGGALHEAEEISRATGHKTFCLTVDRLTENQLLPVQEGGIALFVINELLPGQRPEDIFMTPADPVTIENQHLVATLPEDRNKIISALPPDLPIIAISDRRGSSLYLSGKKQLQHLTWLCKIAQEHKEAVVFLSKGVPRSLYVDLMFRTADAGGLQIENYIPGLNTFYTPSHLHLLSRDFDSLFNLTYVITDCEQIIETFLSQASLSVPAEIKMKLVSGEITNAIIATLRDSITFVPKFLIKDFELLTFKYLERLLRDGEERAKKFLNVQNVRKPLYQEWKWGKFYDPEEIEILRSLTLEKAHRLIAAIGGLYQLTIARSGIFYPTDSLGGISSLLMVNLTP